MCRVRCRAAPFSVGCHSQVDLRGMVDDSSESSSCIHVVCSLHTCCSQILLKKYTGPDTCQATEGPVLAGFSPVVAK